MPSAIREHITTTVEYAAPQASAANILADWPAEDLFRANLAALKERDAPLAQRLAETAIPDCFQLAEANDGSVTYRRVRPDGRRSWLGNSSVPLLAAQAQLARTTFTTGNLAMNGIGNGAEARAFLEHMAPYQALLVLEPELLNVKLAMHLRDFTAALAGGRLVLLVGEDPLAKLMDFYQSHPGYNIIEQSIAWAWLSDQENQIFNQRLTAVMQQVADKILAGCERLFNELQQHQSEPLPIDSLQTPAADGQDTLRAVNCTNVYSVTEYSTSRDALASLAQLGAGVDLQVLDKPDAVSTLAQLERLNKIKPHLILLVDALRKDINPRLPAFARCVTLLRQPAEGLLAKEPAQRIGPNDFILCSRQEQVETLEQAKVPAEQVAYLPPAADHQRYQPVRLTEAEKSRYESDVVLLAHRASTDPETYNITLPTHKQLWQAIIEEISRRPEQYQRQTARQFLQRAQKCGIRLREEDLIKFFTQLLQNYLGEAVLVDTYCQAVVKSGVKLRIWQPPQIKPMPLSANWQQSPVGQLAAAAEDDQEMNKIYNAGKIFLHISSEGWPTTELLDCIGAGGFCLVRMQPRHLRQGGLASLFEPGREIITFDTADDLVRKAKYYLKNEGERNRIAEAGRRKLLAKHTYKQRMKEMLEVIARKKLPT